MGVHDPHSGPDTQVLRDGCHECAARAGEVDHGLSHLDRLSFRSAWKRAASLNREGLADVSATELPLLGMLWSVQIKLEDCCDLPIGKLPDEVRWDE